MALVGNENPVLPIIGCFLLSGLFVGSLYVWDSKYDRNHPSTIKKRFLSVFVVILLSPFVLQLFITSKELKSHSIFELIGLRFPGIFFAAVIPLCLTMVLFLGPLCMLELTTWQSLIDMTFWIENLKNLIWIRNIIIAPLAEEFTFRACMLPLLLQSFKSFSAIFLCSLFFGLAHIHHVVERYQAGESYSILIIPAVVQFSYTTVFGAYSALIFYKTGHFIAPFIVHAFCNVMGYPDFGRIFTFENPKRGILIFLYIAGVLLWYLLLGPLLNDQIYTNYVYFNQS